MSMTLVQVRDWHRKQADACGNMDYLKDVGAHHNRMADAIDAHLAQPAQSVDVERKYKWICDAFDGMKTSRSERFLECLGIEGNVCKAFDDLLTAALQEKGNG